MLPERILKIENSNKLFYYVGKCARYFYFNFMDCFSCCMAFLRRHGYRDKHFEQLRRLKGSHRGERCFIIATGPSLRLNDVEKLDKEFTIAMNSVCLLYDKTDWRPSMLGIQDVDVFKKVAPILEKNPKNVFLTDEICKKMHCADRFHQFPINCYYHLFDYRYSNKLNVRFSDDAYAIVYDAYSITFSLMQIAIYMGFKEIILLGCDCNQQVGLQNHFIETGHVEEESKLKSAADRNIYSHEEIKKFCDSKGVQVFNATRGGNLEVYPRVNFDELLQENG